MKKTIKLLILAAAVVLQAAVIILPLLYLRQFSLPLNTIFTVISMLMVFYLIRLDINPAYKIPWIFILLVFPFFGWIVYGMYGKNYFTRKERRRFANIGRMYMDATALANNRIEELKEVIPYRYPEAKYLMDYGNSAVYGGTSCKYFSCGEDMYEALLTELAKAENFIFMEYFIIEEGKMLSQIVNILIDKVKKVWKSGLCTTASEVFLRQKIIPSGFLKQQGLSVTNLIALFLLWIIAIITETTERYVL